MTRHLTGLGAGVLALCASALLLAGCGKAANVGTPSPGEGAAGVVSNPDPGARMEAARPDQTPSYGQAGAAPSEMRSGTTPTTGMASNSGTPPT